MNTDTILFNCSGCGKKLRVPASEKGKRAKCPGCGALAAIPTPEVAAKGPATAGSEPSPAETSPGALPPLIRSINQFRTDPTLASEAGTAGQKSLEDTQSDRPAERLPQQWDFLAPPQSADEMGRLGQYRILSVLGSGGMGVVFHAEDIRLKRVVALKVMLPRFVASMDSARERFLREARATAAIEHDHIVTIFQVDEDRGVPFIAMQMLRGESLDKRMKREGKLPLREVLRIGRQTAEALAAAHARGLVHRDIKPSNIWLEESGRVKLLDFGLALASDDMHLTQTGAIVGTPAYMSPEQANVSHNVDHRTDLFSLGCVLYRLSTGKPAFSGANTMATLLAIQLKDPESPARLDPALPPAFTGLVMQLLAKQPDKRPRQAQDAVDRLRWIESQLPPVPVTPPEVLDTISLPPLPKTPPVPAVTPLDHTAIEKAEPDRPRIVPVATPAVPVAPIPLAPPVPLPSLPVNPVQSLKPGAPPRAIPLGPPPPGVRAAAPPVPGHSRPGLPRLVLWGVPILLVIAAVSFVIAFPGLIFPTDGPDPDPNKQTVAQTGPGKTTTADKKTTPGENKPPAVPDPPPVPTIGFDLCPRVNYQYETNRYFGLVVAEDSKPLTYAPDGRNQSTALRVDDQFLLLNDTTKGKRLISESEPGWPKKGKPLDSTRTKNSWQMYGTEVRITQVVDVLAGKQPRAAKPGEWEWTLDTCVAGYLIENLDTKPHSVGLRVMLDTKVGDKDGVPFAAPGLSEPVAEWKDFRWGDVPLFLQALELPDLRAPGTVAHLRPKLGTGFEPPDRVDVTRYDTGHVNVWMLQTKPMTTNACVVLYWLDKELKAGEKRYLGFSYGLGQLATDPKQNATGPQVALTCDGDFEPGKDFIVLAHINNWEAGVKLKLVLEPWLTLPKLGDKEQKIEQTAPQPFACTTSLVTWKVRAEKAGKYQLRVESSTGATLQQTIFVAAPDPEKALDTKKLFK